MISRVVVVPHPPLLVPELVPGAAAETAELRAAAVDAARWLADATEHWVAIAADEQGPRTLPADVCGSFAAYGADVTVSLCDVPAGSVQPLPLPVLVAGWLREQAGVKSVRTELVSPAATPADCRAHGARVATAGDQVGALVLGDGAICHGPAAPGRADERAMGFDASVADALAEVDTHAIAALHPALAAELGAIGRAAWQVAAGIVEQGRWAGKLQYSGSPFGVGYHVALWERL